MYDLRTPHRGFFEGESGMKSVQFRSTRSRMDNVFGWSFVGKWARNRAYDIKKLGLDMGFMAPTLEEREADLQRMGFVTPYSFGRFGTLMVSDYVTRQVVTENGWPLAVVEGSVLRVLNQGEGGVLSQARAERIIDVLAANGAPLQLSDVEISDQTPYLTFFDSADAWVMDRVRAGAPRARPISLMTAVQGMLSVLAHSEFPCNLFVPVKRRVATVEWLTRSAMFAMQQARTYKEYAGLFELIDAAMTRYKLHMDVDGVIAAGSKWQNARPVEDKVPGLSRWDFFPLSYAVRKDIWSLLAEQYPEAVSAPQLPGNELAKEFPPPATLEHLEWHLSNIPELKRVMRLYKATESMPEERRRQIRRYGSKASANRASIVPAEDKADPMRSIMAPLTVLRPKGKGLITDGNGTPIVRVYRGKEYDWLVPFIMMELEKKFTKSREEIERLM